MRKLLLFVLIAFLTAMNAQAQDCPRIFTKGDTLYTDPAPQYQWFRDDNPINGATKQWYLPTKGGNFSVQISGTTEEFSYTPPTVEKTITGRIVDERYEPIADVLISVGVKNVKSDAKGRFILEGVPVSNEKTVVTITKAGFWKNSQRLHFFEQDTAALTAMLEPLKVTNRFDAQKGATISERGFFLTFPPNSAVTENGQVYTGTINISLKRSFPSEDGFGLRMPGGDFSAIDQNGQEKMLVSYGFMSAEINGSNGEKLQLASDKEATLEFYIPWEQNKTAPDSMPLWHFDETAGTWRPEGTARKVGPRYVGTVKHFSSWNCDVPRERATVKGKARNCKGTLIPNVVITVGQRVVTADMNGEYTAYVPSDTEFDITARRDTVSVARLVESEEREVKDLEGNAILGAVGLIDSTGTLTVWGYGVESYSVDSGKTFHSKGKQINVNKNELTQGIARDMEGCEVKFRIYRLAKQGDCQLLDSITLAQKQLYKSITEALTSNEMIYRLSLNGQFQGSGEILSVFRCLQLMDLGYNQLTSLPESIGQLQNLQYLFSTKNQLSSLPKTVGQLQNLKSLVMFNNQLTSLPESIGQLQNLQSLDLTGNQISILPESVGQLQNLQILYIIYNQLTTLPESIGQLTSLKELDLSNNKLSSLPESFGQLQNLQMLDLGNNGFTNLPEFVCQLKNLKRMSILNNKLSSLPGSFAQLQNLQMLDLGNNRFTNLPEFVCQLKNLQKLFLNNSRFSSLPESIGLLTKLQELSLNNNQLTSLPESIANLKDNLKVLELRGNPIPEEEKAKIRSWLPNTEITF